jgi:hypothetical protein
MVACQAANGLLPPGPPKDILCNKALEPVIEKAFTKAAQIYEASSKGDWLQVLYLVGDITLACQLTPDFPGKDIACGAVAELIKDGAKLVKAGAALGKDALDGGVEVLGTAAAAPFKALGFGKAGVSPEWAFYEGRAKPLLHQRALLRLLSKNAFLYLGFDQKMMTDCVNLVGYNGAQQKLGETLCKQKSAQLQNEATALAKLVATAPGAYFGPDVAPLMATTQYWTVANPRCELVCDRFSCSAKPILGDACQLRREHEARIPRAPGDADDGRADAPQFLGLGVP